MYFADPGGGEACSGADAGRSGDDLGAVRGCLWPGETVTGEVFLSLTERFF